MRRPSLLPAVVFGAFLAGCGQNDTLVAGGSSSEVPNALTGTANDESGWPVAGAKVTLRPADYQPGTEVAMDSTTTDSSGSWSLPTRSGAWTLELAKGGDGWVSELSTWGRGESRRDTLRRCGWIRGRIGKLSSTAPRVWIAGTAHHAECDSTGSFVLGPLPPATLRLVSLVDSAGVPLLSQREITPRSGDTLEVGDLKGDSWSGEDYTLWPSSRSAVLDFTPTGGSASGDHSHFPVLVRLDSVLDPAKVSRDELRFDDGRGLHLPFEIETWDTATHRADVWVRLDTANGGSSKHLLRAYWGRRRSLPQGAPAVFSSSEHWLGTWHSLTQSTSPRLRFSGATATAGLAGSGIHFGGSANLRMDSLGKASQWTIGFWLRPTAIPSGEILLLGVDTLADSLRWGISLRDDLFVKVWSGGSPDKELLSAKALPLGKWTWISASFDGATSRLSLVVDTVALPRLTVAMPVASDLRLSGMQGFVGDMDELRISDSLRERQWQQLEHQTTAADVPWIRWK